MAQKRVLIFCLAYYPRFIGGDGVAVKEITDRIDPGDIEFHMITCRFDSTLPKEEKFGNVVVHRIGFARPHPSMADLKKFPLHFTKAIFQISAAFKALSLNRKYKFDATWAMMAHSAGVPAALFKLMKPKIPYLLTLQEGDPPEYIERVMKPFWPLFTRAFTRADMVQVISTFLGNWARRRDYKGDLEVIPNAVNTKHFSHTYSESELSELKNELGKKEGDVFLITTSRLVHKNALDDVIRALPNLPKNIRFIILGIGPDEEMLRALAQELSVESRVTFLGLIDHKEMPKYLRVSDIFIRPSRSEGMGNSFVEAMAADLPVIATQEGGIADFLFDKKRNPDKAPTGFAVDKDSPDQIAEAVTYVLGNPEEVRKVIQEAHTLAFEKFDWELIARDMREKVFKKVLEK
jgi:glycosyltransferase involved in cell wall biosynthesis